MNKKKVLVVLGPTALGKTDISLKLAKKYNGELVACDSRQLYKGMDIGTGKLPKSRAEVTKGDGFWVINGVKVWLYDAISPSENFNVRDYEELARKIIEKILREGKIPIIVGGSGLYLKGLLEGLGNFTIPPDPKLRFLLESLNLESLQYKLRQEQPEVWENMNESDRANKRRLVRKLEIAAMTNYRREEKKIPLEKEHLVLKIGLSAPREVLYARIDARVEARIKQGMIEEAVLLHANGMSVSRMKSFGLEYGCLADFIEGKIDKEELIEQLKNKIHQFSKRQITWFKKERGVNWFDITSQGVIEKIEHFVSDWLGVVESPK